MLNRPIPVDRLEYYREQDKDSRRETLQYYTDNETISREHGLLGEWEIFLKDGAAPLCAGMVQGEQVQWDVIEALSKGENPDTGESYGIQRSSKKAISAEDWTFSAPKPYSVLHGIAKANSEGDTPEAEVFRKIAEITLEGHRRGVRAGMDLGFSEEAIAARFGKGGKERAGVTFIGGARFDHFTSRDGDMQLHSHLVIPKVARAADGSVRSWDNHKMTVLRGKMSAAYRAEMMAYAKRELAKIGIQIHFSKDGRNFKIDGIEKNACDHFSKRRTAILNKMYEKGYNNTRDHRAAAQIASFATRRSKAELPPMPILYDRWNYELKQLGYTPGSILRSIDVIAGEKEREKNEKFAELKAKAKENGEAIPTIRPDLDSHTIALDAVKDITVMESTFERSKFETTMFEHLQFNCDAATAIATIDAVRDTNAYVQIGVKGRSKEGVFTDAKTLTEEYELMELETRMRGNVQAIDPKFIEQAISEGIEKTDGSGERFHLNKEQAALVWHLLSGNQINDGIGDAGTGKTTTMIVVRRALELAGYELHLTAPTNKAVSGLAKELGIPIDRGYSVARFIMDYEKGKIELGPKSFTILDEAGMVSRSDLLKLDQIAEATGCRFGRVGDPKQLPPVQAGAPFRMTTEAFGAGRLMEIARQKDAWARQASKDLANGNVRDGIMAHYDRGGVLILDSAEEVHQRTIAEAMKLEREEPGSVIVLSPTNEERRALSRQLIDEKIAAGIMTGEQYFYDHADRGTDEIQNSLIMVGSVVALAESVTYNDERYPNNAMGRVTKIEADGEREPYVTVKWEDGRSVTFKPSTFVGFREEGDPLAKVPKLAPADCLTDYQSQGLTSKYAIRVATGAMSTQSAYVSMTRQKEKLLVLVDGSRLEADLANKQGKVFTMGKDGSSRQEDDTPQAVITKEQKLDRFIEECERTNSKANACDLLGGAKQFHQNYREHYNAKFTLNNNLHIPVMKEENKMQTTEERQREENANGIENGKRSAPGRPMPRGIGRIGGQVPEVATSKGAAELAAIAERRSNAVAEPEIAKSPKVQALKARKKSAEERRIEREQEWKARAKAEADYLYRDVDLADYAMSKGAFVKKGNEKTYKRSSGGETFYELSWGEGQGLNVTHKSDGTWVFWDRASGIGGDIVNFYQFNNKLTITTAKNKDKHSFKTAMEGLRAEFGLARMDFKDRPVRSHSHTPAAPKLIGRELFESELEKARNYDKQKISNASRGWTAGTFIKNTTDVNRDLLSRGISAQRQIELSSMGVLKNESAAWKDRLNSGTAEKPVWESVENKNIKGWLVSMKTAWNTLTGYIRKGPVDPDKGGRFSKNGSSSQRALVVYGNTTAMTRIVLDESISDSMTRYERDGALREKTRYVATAGNPGDTEVAMVFDMARKNPGMEWAMGVQDDAANVRFREKMTAAIVEGDPTAKFVDLPVAPGFKDISEQHKTENADRIKAELAAFDAAQVKKPEPVRRPVPQKPTQPVVRTPATPAAPTGNNGAKRPVPQKPVSRWKDAEPVASIEERKRQIEEQARRDQEQANKPKAPSR